MSCHPVRRLLGLSALVSPLTAAAAYRWSFPEPVTPIAHDTLRIHNEFMLIIIALFVAVFAIMVYSLIKHRKSAGHEAATFTGPNGRLQWFWALVPFAMLMYIDFVLMGVPAVQAIVDMEDTRTRADMVLKVTGMQWRWQYEYPEAGLKFLSSLATPREQINGTAAKGENYLLEVDNEIVLPVGKKVRVLLTSMDVIHTWWVPQFGVKRDAIPGFLRETWLRIDQPGVYRGQCAELCGKDHGFMPVVVRAVPEPEYLAWIDAQKARQSGVAAGAGRAWSKDELMAKGKEVYATLCVACHQPEGKGLPPVFPALAGSKVINSPLLSPEGKLLPDSHPDRVMNGKPGTPMQAFKNTLSDVDLAAVITFERNAFGNTRGDMIQPAQIKALR
ncbi:MAG: cytochrome c oxidase subunit II [Betaproteobacteria bacterium]